MPDNIAHLKRTIRFHVTYAHRLVEDLTPEQMTAVPGVGHENHPAFTLGHLVTGLDLTAQDLGLASDLAHGWADLFLRRGPADRRTPSNDIAYPTREQLLAELERHAERVIGALAVADPDWLGADGETWKLSAYLPTNHDTVLFMTSTHMAMHLGQLASWRRAMGLPAAMAGM